MAARRLHVRRHVCLSHQPIGDDRHGALFVSVPTRGVKVLYHCWHDVNVKFPGGSLHTVDAPTSDGRVCCYCGEIRPEPLPPLRRKRAHGPFVDDDSEWYVVDELECPGLGLVELNAEAAVVRDETTDT